MEISPADCAHVEMAQRLPQMPLDIVALYSANCELVRELQTLLLTPPPYPKQPCNS